MVPSHSSGLCAVAWHLFYNSKGLAPVVAAQAALTLVGNSTCAFAAYRAAAARGWTWRAADRALPFALDLPFLEVAEAEDGPAAAAEEEPKAEAMREEAASAGRASAAAFAAAGGEGAGAEGAGLGSDVVYTLKLAAGSVAAAAAVKWGSLLGGAVFVDRPANALAFGLVGAATAANAFKWYRKASAKERAAA